MEVEEYRKLPFINYSACKDFDKSRTDFFRKYILKEYVEDKRSSDTIFGDLVHCLLLRPEDFDTKFTRMTVGATPKPQMKAFADNLWEVTRQCMSPEGLITRSAESLMEEAFLATAYDSKGERVAFKGKTLADVIARFPEEAEFYYKLKRESFGKDVINAQTYENAEKCVQELHINPVTKPIFSIANNSRYMVFNEHVITFQYNGQTLKALLDKVIVDTKEKKIEIYDLKCTGWEFGYFEGNIIKHRYYLQWTMYYLAVKQWAVDQGFEGFQIVPMQFITLSTDMSENPLIFTTSEKDVEYGLKGFSLRGKPYKGLDQIITEIAWHSTYGIWNMSYTDYQNKGIRKLNLFEEE